MDWLMYWTGVAVWLTVGCYVLLLAYHAGKGFCVAVDWLRWRLAINRASGLPLLLRTLPKTFALRWWEFTISPSGSRFYGEYGCWEGYLQWTVYPPASGMTPNVEVTGLQRPERNDDEHTNFAGR